MKKRFDFIVRTKQDLIDAVQEFGIVPLFENAIPGFSVEEHTVPTAWFDSEQDGVWEWKGPVIRESGCAYGKFFEKKAAFISAELFLDFANYRRSGYDFDARWDEGLAPHGDKFLYDLIDANGPVLSKLLKQLGEYGKNGRKGFDTAINRLQAQGYVLISDFVYLQDKHGFPYGWGVAEYTTPEKLFGERFTDTVYHREPEESHATHGCWSICASCCRMRKTRRWIGSCSEAECKECRQSSSTMMQLTMPLYAVQASRAMIPGAM